MSADASVNASGFEDSSPESERIRRALLRLSPDYHIPLVPYTCQDFSVAQIAVALSISPDAVKQRPVRARQQLRADYQRSTIRIGATRWLSITTCPQLSGAP
jgi:DNA-directed RNA polymerase specialized sigma24 family protein